MATINRRPQPVTEDISDSNWSEGTTKTLTGSNDDVTITLAKGANQRVHKVLITAPGAIGDITVVFYDNTPATTPISGTLYLASQPAEGFTLNKSLNSSKLGIRLAGYSSGSTTAYINVRYSY